jgi:hypothetical protein
MNTAASPRRVDTSFVDIGADHPDVTLSLPEDGLRRLTRIEQRGARKQYDAWSRRLAAGGDVTTDVERQAMNMTFIGRALFWLRLLQPVGVAAVILLYVFNQNAVALTIGLVLLAIALVFVRMLALRWTQSRIFWPGKVVPPKP